MKEGLDKAQRQIENDFRTYNRHRLINVEPLTERIRSAFTTVKEELDKTKEKHPDLMQENQLRNKITELFDGKVGPPYGLEKLEAIYKLGDKRYREKIPPGYSDAKKEGTERYGDLVLWFQIIDKAKEIRKPIIFVTDDGKEDWWYIFKGQTIGPRPQLVDEMLAEATVSFYMYHPESFMEHLKNLLKSDIEPKVIEEVKNIRQEDKRTIQHIGELWDKLSQLAARENVLSQRAGLWDKLSKFAEREDVRSQWDSVVSARQALREQIVKIQEAEPSPTVRSAVEMFGSTWGESMEIKNKLNVIRNYLNVEFPGNTVEDQYDFDRTAQTFRIANDRIHLVTISRAFLDDHDVSEIESYLKGSHLSKYFQREGVNRITVTNSGIRQE